jgi:hypothetical protein
VSEYAVCCIYMRQQKILISADSSVGRSGCARGGTQITRFSTTADGYLADQVADHIDGRSARVLLDRACQSASH